VPLSGIDTVGLGVVDKLGVTKREASAQYEAPRPAAQVLTDGAS